jgi:hypothetical protein
MMRIEPKTFFANERTFLSWLHMAVTLGSIAAALLGFSTDSGKVRDNSDPTLGAGRGGMEGPGGGVLCRLRRRECVDITTLQ